MGKLDLSRIGMIGHGHGSLLAMQSARIRNERARSRNDDGEGNAPLIGVLLVAPLYSLEGDADVPLSVILPSCDGVAPDLNGQGYYEDARLDKGRTVWSVAKPDTKWFAPSDASFMINYRVDDLAALLADLRAAGVEVLKGPDADENGTFAWIRDPDGNKVELWEPKAPAAQDKTG